MTTTTPTPTAAANPLLAPPVAVARPLKPRRRRGLTALGIALIALGALAAVLLVGRLSHSVQVLALSGAVSRGEVIEASDLAVVDLPAGASALRSVDAGQIDSIAGQRAASDLPAGSLLTPDSYTAQITPPSQRSVVGIALTPAQRPNIDLRSGDKIRIVETPVSQGDPPVETPVAIAAAVISISPIEGGNTVIVNVEVATSDAADLAARAATGRVALVLDSLED